MSYDSKIQSAQKVIEDHNENADSPVNFDDFLKKMRDLGGSSDGALKAISWEDLQECGVPKIMARRLAHLFRQDSDDEKTKSVYVSDRKAKSMSIRELLERYNPQDVKNAIGERLKKISEGKPCIVFLEDGRVNVDASEDQISALQQGFEPVNNININGKPHRIFKVGVPIDVYADANPLSNRPLRPGGICSDTGRSWEKVSQIVRQLIYIANHITMELVLSASNDSVHGIMDLAIGENAEQVFRQRYPNASIYYDEHEKLGDLPKLKIKLSGEGYEKSNKSNNPFGQNTSF